jgi:ATP-dependent Clp protease ATP-binding subunit ClpC
LFERFTEQACRTIFRARYEAGALQSDYIETEHLLLGILREDKQLPGELPASALEAIRRRFGEPPFLAISTTMDLPLSQESKRVLAFAAEESKTMHHRIIDSGHLVLGLLRVEDCLAAALLRENGVDYARYRDVVDRSVSADNPVAWSDKR